MSDESPASVAPQADEALLRRFIDERDEEAFRILVQRHGSLVLSACRRGAPSKTDADDAFQATFIVLAQSAEKIAYRESLAAWLYGVACRVCARLRRERARHATSQLLEPIVIYEDPLDELLARHDELATDEELAALPESLRTPLVLRYLAGKSNQQVAEELGITIAALEGRLKRAKTRLRWRLLRRGVTLAAAVAVLRATRVASAELPVMLVDETVTMCAEPVLPTSAGVTGDGSSPIYLAQQEMLAVNTSIFSKPLVAALALGGIATLAVGLQLAVSQGPGADQPAGIALAVEALADAPADHTSARAKLTSSTATDAASPRRATIAGSAGLQWDPELVPLSAAEAKIRKVLSSPLTTGGFEFPDTPLEEVVAFVQDEYKIPIQLDDRALDDAGVGADEPVTIHVRNIKLRSALRLMLRQLGLTCTIKNEVLEITTPEEAELNVDTRVYTIGDWGIEPKELMEIVTSTIAADTWTANGGRAADICQIPEGLVIHQSFAVHEQIIDFFRQLDEHAKRVRHDSSNRTPSSPPRP